MLANEVLHHSPDTCGKLLELDKVFSSLMVFMHTKLFEFGFGFSFGVESTKIGFEFLNESSKSESQMGSLMPRSAGSNNLIQVLLSRIEHN